MFNTQVIMPDEQSTIEEVCRMLWTANFDDTQEYVDYYFNNRWHESITVISDSVSMLNLNPYRVKLNRTELAIYYIVGVCTLKKYRKHGYMDSVLKRAFQYMYDANMPFAYLMPASEKIYRPYGFRGIYPVKAWDGSLKKLEADKNNVIDNNNTVVVYGTLTDNQKDRLVRYAQNCLSKHFSCYVVHDSSYFKELYKEMRACNGDIATFWNEDKCIGYMVYLCEDCDRIEIAESVFEDGVQQEIIKYLRKLNVTKISLYETAFWNLTDTKQQKNYLMARIINLKEFARCLPYGQDMWLDVTDGLISDNNGKWHISTKDGLSLCTSSDGAEHKKYIKCTIEELGQKYLTKPLYYMNELV